MIAVIDYEMGNVMSVVNAFEGLGCKVKVTNRRDSDFWKDCSDLQVPDTLAHRIELFRETARVFRVKEDLFKENSWIQVMMGQGIKPEQYHPVVNVMSEQELTRFMGQIKSRVDDTVAKLPRHEAYVKQYYPASG